MSRRRRRRRRLTRPGAIFQIPGPPEGACLARRALKIRQVSFFKFLGPRRAPAWLVKALEIRPSNLDSSSKVVNWSKLDDFFDDFSDFFGGFRTFSRWSQECPQDIFY